jgi:hypothetical protein
MSKLWLTLLLLVFAQTVFTQVKTDEYAIGGSDSEAARLDNFLTELDKTPDSKGLVVIYSGANGERLGNILGHIKGIKHHAFFRKIAGERLSFLIAVGKETLYKELWVIPKDQNAPEFESLALKQSIFNKKYYYGRSCIDCEPTVPALESGRVDFKFFSGQLKKHKNLKGQIVVNRKHLRYAIAVRKTLIDDYGLKVHRVAIKFNNSDVSRARFYIVPLASRH